MTPRLRRLTISPADSRRAFHAWLKHNFPELDVDPRMFRAWQAGVHFATVAHGDGVEAALAVLERPVRGQENADTS